MSDWRTVQVLPGSPTHYVIERRADDGTVSLWDIWEEWNELAKLPKWWARKITDIPPFGLDESKG